MEKSVFRGNCQVCGRLQAIVGFRIAKHGYTVKGFGYFVGTCHGSDKRPMQVERDLTDATITGLHGYAVSHDEDAISLRTGVVTPIRIHTGDKYIDRKYVPQYIAFEDGDSTQQAHAVHLAVCMHEGEARNARSYAQELTKLVTKVFGTDLLPIEKIERVAPTVDVKAGTVTGAFATKQARKEALDKVTRDFEKLTRLIQNVYLQIPSAQRTEEATEVYYCPMYPHQWKPKHSVLTLKVFPELAEVVAQIEQLVKVREEIKKA